VWNVSILIVCNINCVKKTNFVFLISNFRRVLNVVYFLLGKSPSSDFRGSVLPRRKLKTNLVLPHKICNCNFPSALCSLLKSISLKHIICYRFFFLSPKSRIVDISLPIFYVSRSYSDTPHPVDPSKRSVLENITPTRTDIHLSGGNQTRNSKWEGPKGGLHYSNTLSIFNDT
jgi:hypothetical protein